MHVTLLIIAIANIACTLHENSNSQEAEVVGTSIVFNGREDVALRISESLLSGSLWRVGDSNPRMSPSEAVRIARKSNKALASAKVWKLQSLELRLYEGVQKDYWYYIAIFGKQEGITGIQTKYVVGVTLTGKTIDSQPMENVFDERSETVTEP